MTVTLLSDLDHFETYFRQSEAQVLAFLPEPGRFARLRREAQALLRRYPSVGARPPLFGVLVGVKDIIHVDGFLTRAGSQLPPEVLRGTEADCVAKLRQAGALILGKTQTSEFAYSAPTTTRNPHHQEHTPGGSSSGSAAAVAAGLCPLALGTQTTGSIIRPAAFCGVVGFKPSYDRISRTGIIPLAPSIDHVGFFAPDVSTTSLVASVICDGWQPRDPPRPRPVLGIPEGPYLARASNEGRVHFGAVCRRLALAGYEVKSVRVMSDFEAIAFRHNLILDAEAARVHTRWFEVYLERYGPETAGMILRGQNIEASALTRAQQGCLRFRAALTALMNRHGLDLWLSPAAPGPAPKGLDHTGDAIMCLPWTHSGLPALSLPSGKNSAGLPLGLQVAARYYADEDLLAWSGALEQILHYR
jgi:Asp-tRNA(Asn)/Glu-tRNA(Gln) amidotransferase A subunit family amidase